MNIIHFMLLQRPGLKSPGFLLSAGRVPSLPAKGKGGIMKILKVVLMIRNMIMLKSKSKIKKENTSRELSEVKHPAEFLVRW